MRQPEPCRCGHPRLRHGQRGCAWFIFDGPDTFHGHPCPCKSYDFAGVPLPGERLVFGVHRQYQGDAETADAWPSHATWAGRVKARTTRSLRSLR